MSKSNEEIICEIARKIDKDVYVAKFQDNMIYLSNEFKTKRSANSMLMKVHDAIKKAGYEIHTHGLGIDTESVHYYINVWDR